MPFSFNYMMCNCMGLVMNAMFWHDVQILEFSNTIQKLGLIPRIHYTFPNAKTCMGTKFYRKIKYESIEIQSSIIN